MEKQAGHTSMRAAELSRVVTPPYPGEASKIQVTSRTRETYLVSTQTDMKALAGTWAHEGDGRQKRPGPGPRLPTSPLKRQQCQQNKPRAPCKPGACLQVRYMMKGGGLSTDQDS